MTELYAWPSINWGVFCRALQILIEFNTQSSRCISIGWVIMPSNIVLTQCSHNQWDHRSFFHEACRQDGRCTNVMCGDIGISSVAEGLMWRYLYDYMFGHIHMFLHKFNFRFSYMTSINQLYRVMQTVEFCLTCVTILCYMYLIKQVCWKAL